MKDFNEFLDFINEDCMHEIKAISESYGYVFTDDDFDKVGMSEEAFGTLMRIIGYTIARFSTFQLRRYHEWLTQFPESQPLDHPQ